MKQSNERTLILMKPMLMIVKICKILIHEIVSIPRIIQCLFYSVISPSDIIIVKAYVKYKRGRLVHNNLGDDLNYSFLSEATGKKVLILPNAHISKLIGPQNYYFVIGSILGFYTLKNAVVWGTGLMNDSAVSKGKPKEVLAVRGPLTYAWLVNQGIECSNVFGDPALLLSKFYYPNVQVKYKLGIIPHMQDMDKEDVKRLCMCNEVKVIRVQGYKCWKDVIREIMSCKLIISSSLHGLIISESYCIPSVWAEFGQYTNHWEFKFQDFYASINKADMIPFKVTNQTTIEDIVNAGGQWRTGEINYEALIETCPFKLHKICEDR